MRARKGVGVGQTGAMEGQGRGRSGQRGDRGGAVEDQREAGEGQRGEGKGQRGDNREGDASTPHNRPTTKTRRVIFTWMATAAASLPRH